MNGLNKDMDEAAKYQHYTNTFHPVRVAFETAFPAVFGALVQCVSDDGLTPVTNPGNECKQYWGHGAFIYQLQFVLMYLNLIARIAVVSTDPQVWLATLHSKLQVFSPLLQSSYDGLTFSLMRVEQCQWTFPSCWPAIAYGLMPCVDANLKDGESTDDWMMSADGWCFKRCQSPAWIAGGEEASCITGCRYIVPNDWPNCFDSSVGHLSCEQASESVGLAGGTWATCTKSDFELASQVRVGDLTTKFGPILKQLQNLASTDQYSQILAYVQSNPQPPMPSTPSLEDSHGFCEDFCGSILVPVPVAPNTGDIQLSMPVPNIDQVAHALRQSCRDACFGPIGGVSTICSCRTTTCPAILSSFKQTFSQVAEPTTMLDPFGTPQMPTWFADPLVATCNQSCNVMGVPSATGRVLGN